MTLTPGPRLALVIAMAACLGWWMRGADSAVLAQRSSSSSSSRGSASDGNLAFQITGAGPASSLTVYNPANHTLYVYQRIGEGNAHISCSFSYRIDRPGDAIDRGNCPVGELLP